MTSLKKLIISLLGATILPCEAKRQYRLTLHVSNTALWLYKALQFGVLLYSTLTIINYVNISMLKHPRSDTTLKLYIRSTVCTICAIVTVKCSFYLYIWFSSRCRGAQLSTQFVIVEGLAHPLLVNVCSSVVYMCG